MAQSNLEVVISAKDQFTATANRITGSLNSMNAAAGKVGKGIGQVAGGLGRIALVGAAAVGGALTAATKFGMDFEAELNVINTIAHRTPAELTAIGDGIRQLARDGRGDLSDLSAGFYDILSAGITDTAKAQQVLEVSTRLAMGSLSTNAEAVDLLTTAINAFGQDASAAAADADLFAKAVEIGKVKASEIAASFADVAPIAAQTGIGIEEVAAAYGALTAQGVPAAEVATQMQRAIQDLMGPSKALATLEDKLGVSFFKIAQDKGLVVALEQMREATNGDEAAFRELFNRVEGYKFGLMTTGPQQKIYNDALDAMTHSAGTAADQMGERQHGLAYALKVLRANFKDAGITLETGFGPALERSANKLTAFLKLPEVQAKLLSIGKDIGAAIDRIDWGKVLEGAKAMWDTVKGILDVVSKIPPEVDAAILSFIGLNKLSGGLLGAGIGNIATGLAGGVANGLARGGIGKAFVQPVFVTNMGAGGLGGGMGGAGGAASGGISALGKVLLVGEAIELLSVIKLTNDQIAENTRVQAKQVADTNAAWLAQNPTKAKLQSGLAGTNTGITKLDQDPIAVALNLGGAKDARDSLVAIQGDIQRQLTATYQQEQLLREQNGSTADLSEALRNMPPPQVTVINNVSAREITNVVKSSTSYGTTSSSYYGGSPAPTLSH